MANEKRLIDANEALLNTYNEAYWTESEAAAVRSFLVHRKTVDAVEVVRCKDCQYWDVHPINGRLTLGKCAKLSRVMADTGFCSYGERRQRSD